MQTAIRDLQTLFDVGVLGGRSDGELLERFIARRDGAVFEAIVDRHGPMVWGVCRRVLRDHHDAEDAFQATFLVLSRKAASIMPRERLGNWLYGVAYQTAAKARTMRAKRRGREGQISNIPEPMVGPDDLRDALAESLDRELSRLPEKYRISIVMCELEGRSHREVAEQLGWPIGTVSSRLSRARAMLAERLSRRGVSLSAGTLAVLLAQESASASMPARLMSSTVQAASLIAAGGAVTAGMVSAGVASLTGEVMKMMLLGKLKIGVVILLVASAVAAGGTGLAFQAQTTEPSRKDDLKLSNDGGIRNLVDIEKIRAIQREQEKLQELQQEQYTLQKVYDIEKLKAIQRTIDERTKEAQRLIDKQGQQEMPENLDDLEKIKAVQRSIDEKMKVIQRLIDKEQGEDQRAKVPDQRSKEQRYAKAMTALEEEAKGKSPKELEKMIEEAHWQARVWDAKRVRLQQLKEATEAVNRAGRR